MYALNHGRSGRIANHDDIAATFARMQYKFLVPILITATCWSCHPRTGAVENKDQVVAHTEQAGNPYYSRSDTTLLNVTNSVWKLILPDSLYRVARKKETELAFTGKYWNYSGLGIYYCAVCGNALFRSDEKFSSTCGWPSFFETMRPTAVVYQADLSFGMDRTEVLCGRCGSHLGHLFNDGPPPTGKRYCMNSIVLEFVPDDGSKPQ